MAVARPVTRNEWIGNVKAEAALNKEWTNLMDRGVIEKYTGALWPGTKYYMQCNTLQAKTPRIGQLMTLSKPC